PRSASHAVVGFRHRGGDQTLSHDRSTALLIHANSYDDPAMLHASGFLAPDPFTYLEMDDQRVILASALEAGRARKQSRATAVREMDEFGIQAFMRETKSWDEAYAKTLDRFLTAYGVREVTVPREFPLY